MHLTSGRAGKGIALGFCLLLAGLTCLAQAQLTLTGAGKKPAGASCPGCATWDPAHTSGTITLSNGNLTLTQGTSAFSGSIATVSASSGLKFYQAHIDTKSGNIQFGIGNISTDLTTYLGMNQDSIGWGGSDGVVILANSVITTIQTFAAGDTISIALDLGINRIWFRTNSGNWNNDAGADPTLGSGGAGISLGTINSGPYFPAASISTSTNAITANFGQSTFSPAAPSGFTQW